MKIAALLVLSAVLCFSASPTVVTAATAVQAISSEAEAWPGGNRKARRITKRARKRTNGITQFAAFKVMKRRKAKRKKFRRAAKNGFNKADKAKAPRKKAGCNT